MTVRLTRSALRLSAARVKCCYSNKLIALDSVAFWGARWRRISREISTSSAGAIGVLTELAGALDGTGTSVGLKLGTLLRAFLGSPQAGIAGNNVDAPTAPDIRPAIAEASIEWIQSIAVEGPAPSTVEGCPAETISSVDIIAIKGWIQSGGALCVQYRQCTGLRLQDGSQLMDSHLILEH